MHTNPQLRESLIHQADEAFVGLMTQVDYLLNLAGFWLDRWPSITHADNIKTKELVHTVTLLGKLSTDLAALILLWKNNQELPFSPMTSELVTLNEIWSNVQALIYFFASAEIDMEPFNHDVAARYFATLVRSNRLVT